MMAACRIVIGIVLVVVIGFFLILSSLVLVPHLIRHKVEQQLILTSSSEGFKAWLTPQVPVFIDFYFFNVTNSEHFTGNWSVRPKVEQIGPYVYREVMNKSDIEFSKNGRNLRFRQNRWYFFERNMSCGDENDAFVTVNLPLLAAGTRFQSESKQIQLLMKMAIIFAEQHLFEVHTVKELLWGYKLKLPPAYPWFVRKIIDNLIAEYNGNSTDFGFYVGSNANGTDDGFYVIDTGVGEVSSLRSTDMWNGKMNLSCWSNKYSNMINGTDGSAWHPFVSADERLYSFSSDFYRSTYLTCGTNCSKNLDVSSATIPVYRFTQPAEVFADPNTNPDNQGFCVSSPCFESGVLDLSTCRNAPVILSEPHFYQASRTYQEAIDGLSPSSEYHQTFAEVEPITGIAFHLNRKVQINTHLRYLSTIREMDSMDENASIVFPILWLNARVKVSDEDAAKFQDEVLKPMNIASNVIYAMYGNGAVLLLVAVVCIVWSIVVIVRSKIQAIIINQDPDIDDDDAQLLDAGSA